MHKLKTRLSKGEKRNAKRMAEVAAVYTIERHHRTPEDIIGDAQPVQEVAPARPRPEHKRVWASLEKTPMRSSTARSARRFTETRRGSRISWSRVALPRIL